MAPSRQQRLILQAGLLPRTRAAEAWAEVASELVTDASLHAHAGLLPVVAHNLGDLAGPLLPRLLSVQRSTWYRNQLMLGRIAGQIGSAYGPSPVLLGETASVIHYLPTLSLREIRSAEVRVDWRGPTVPAQIRGIPVRVPAPADHLLDVLLRRWWIDAAYAASNPAMDWDRFVAEVRGRNQVLTVRGRLAILAELAGPATLGEDVAERLRPTVRDHLRQRIHDARTLARSITRS